MLRYRLISITRWGKKVDIENFDFFYIGKDVVLGYRKGYGFMYRFDISNGYEVITELVD